MQSIHTVAKTRPRAAAGAHANAPRFGDAAVLARAVLRAQGVL